MTEEIYICIGISVTLVLYVLLQMLEYQWSNSVCFLLHDFCSFPPIFCPPKWSHLFTPVNFTALSQHHSSKDVTSLCYPNLKEQIEETHATFFNHQIGRGKEEELGDDQIQGRKKLYFN